MGCFEVQVRGCGHDVCGLEVVSQGGPGQGRSPNPAQARPCVVWLVASVVPWTLVPPLYVVCEREGRRLIHGRTFELQPHLVKNRTALTPALGDHFCAKLEILYQAGPAGDRPGRARVVRG